MNTSNDRLWTSDVIFHQLVPNSDSGRVLFVNESFFRVTFFNLFIIIPLPDGIWDIAIGDFSTQGVKFMNSQFPKKGFHTFFNFRKCPGHDALGNSHKLYFTYVTKLTGSNRLDAFEPIVRIDSMRSNNQLFWSTRGVRTKVESGSSLAFYSWSVLLLGCSGQGDQIVRVFAS
jgi:hypothetical protein